MAPDSADVKLTAARCVDCDRQLTLKEFRESRGSAHRCANCRIKGGYPAAGGKASPAGGKSSRRPGKHWTGREKLAICTVCDEGVRMRERRDGQWIAYEEDEDRRHRHRG